MAIIAPTFDFMKVSPANDGLLYKGLSGGDRVIKGYGDEFTVRTSGLTVTLNPGAAIVQGRLIYTDSATNISVPANTTGYICLTVDLSKTNTFTGIPGEDNYKPVNNQARIEFVRSLVQQDIHTSGKIYNMPITKVTSNGSTVTAERFLSDIYVPSTYVNGFKPYSPAQTPVLYKDGNMCYLTGGVTNTTTIAGGAGITILKIPEEYVPVGRTATSLCQGSGGSIFLLSVQSNGDVGMERYRNGSAYFDCKPGAWLTLDLVWSVR